MIAQLELLGFQNPYAFRVGPCSACLKTITTYYIPEQKRWICEHCFYAKSENTEFISFLTYEILGKPMSGQDYQALLQEMQALRNQVAQLKAKGTANVFVGDSGNLTIKHREINPRGWAIPTKNDRGVTYFRGGDFPMSYSFSQDGTKLILHDEIPIDAQQAQTFREHFIMQNMVISKRKAEAQNTTPTATPHTAYVAPTPTVATPAPTPIAPSGYTKASLISEAQALVDAGAAKTLAEAIPIVETSRKVKFSTLP